MGTTCRVQSTIMRQRRDLWRRGITGISEERMAVESNGRQEVRDCPLDCIVMAAMSASKLQTTYSTDGSCGHIELVFALMRVLGVWEMNGLEWSSIRSRAHIHKRRLEPIVPLAVGRLPAFHSLPIDNSGSHESLPKQHHTALECQSQ